MSSETEQKKTETDATPNKGAGEAEETQKAASGAGGASAPTAAATATPSDKAPGAPTAEPDVPLEGRIFRRRYFVSVSKKNRITCLLVSMACLAFVLYLNISYTPRAAIGNSHIIEIKEPGNYLALFKGPITDPYGWQSNGVLRLSLVVSLEPLKPDPPGHPSVMERHPYKNLAGIDYFSVAEFEVAQPGEYLLSSKWVHVEATTTEGYIVLEQDPVEKFFARWFSGIIGGIAFLIAVGFPVSARMAAATEVPPGSEKK